MREETPTAAVGAVIVPSYQRLYRLQFAAELAATLDCQLLLISALGTEARVRSVLESHPYRPDAWNVAVPHAGSLRGLHLASSDHPGAGPLKHRDAATKRNLGLAVALMVGWERVLLLDDDIRALTGDDVRRAAGWVAAAAGLRVASWRAVDCADNSAVCHAGRLAGLPQDVFVGSGAMLVDVYPELPMFPSVYNEDWLFLFDDLRERRVVEAGVVDQLLYNPFDPRHHRGREEEFGDVLGEGLYHLLHQDLPVDTAEDPNYWRHVVAERQRMIAEIRAVLSDPSGPYRHRAHTAITTLDKARAQHVPDLALQLADFVAAWRHHDLPAWRAWLAKRAPADGVAEAVRSLGLEARPVASSVR